MVLPLCAKRMEPESEIHDLMLEFAVLREQMTLHVCQILLLHPVPPRWQPSC